MSYYQRGLAALDIIFLTTARIHPYELIRHIIDTGMETLHLVDDPFSSKARVGQSVEMVPASIGSILRAPPATFGGSQTLEYSFI